jgi:hypothetical protein
MSQNITVNVRARRIVVALDGTENRAIAGVELHNEQQYSNGIVRELLPVAVQNDDLVTLFSDSDLQTIFVRAHEEMVLRGVTVPTLP